MKKILSLAAVLAMVLMLAACGGGSDKVTPDSLNGEWTIDIQASMKAMGQENDAAAMLVAEMLKDMTFKFDTAAKTISVNMAGQTESKPFEVASQKDNTFVLKSDGETINVVLEKNNGKDTLTISQGDGNEKFVLIKK